jgi:hypothetical protein
MALKLMLQIYLLATALLSSARAFGAELHRVELIVGESKTLEIENAIKVHVTRKGIIHLLHEEDSRWRMTALRSGMVAIEVKSSEQRSRTIYVLVKPRSIQPESAVRDRPAPNPQCPPGQQYQTSQYEIQTIVEMITTSRTKSNGSGLNTALRVSPTSVTSSVMLESNFDDVAHDRTIIGDPVITASPCTDIVINAGGEEATYAISDHQTQSTTWKLHGLAIKMRILPLSQTKIRIPYSVSLRVPAKRQGSYSLSEAQSTMDIKPGETRLAAIINLASMTGERRAPFLLSDIPILGPLITGQSSFESNSKLSISIHIQSLNTLLSPGADRSSRSIK